jgi:hypothetical protein
MFPHQQQSHEGGKNLKESLFQPRVTFFLVISKGGIGSYGRPSRLLTRTARERCLFTLVTKPSGQKVGVFVKNSYAKHPTALFCEVTTANLRNCHWHLQHAQTDPAFCFSNRSHAAVIQFIFFSCGFHFSN